MFYKSVLEQMYSVFLMNLYIYRPIGGDKCGQCLRTDSRPDGCALYMQLSWQLNMLMRNRAHSLQVKNYCNFFVIILLV